MNTGPSAGNDTAGDHPAVSGTFKAPGPANSAAALEKAGRRLRRRNIGSPEESENQRLPSMKLGGLFAILAKAEIQSCHPVPSQCGNNEPFTF
jgi:hypothetical protein